MRSWLRSPRLALTLLACIAVSIGGVATVLTFVHALLIKPLPFPEPDRLVALTPLNLRSSDRAYFSYPNFADLRGAARSFALLEGATVSRLVLQTTAGSERLRGETVTPGYFDLLGARPLLGRTFTAEEYAGTGPRAIILSHRLWQTRFGGDPALIGQPVTTRVGPAVVVGIMPASYIGIGEESGTDYWFAEKQNNHPDMLRDRETITTLVIGRLRPGVSTAEAQGEVDGILRGLVAAHPTVNARLGARLEPIGERWRAPLRGGLVTMLVGSGFLLLIGCANVALLLLARLIERERELALRLSLGASRAALVRMMLGESLALAAAGGALGVLLAMWLVELFVKTAGVALPPHLPVAFAAAPVAWCALVVLGTGIAFGVLPALAATRVNAAQALRAGGRGLAGGSLRRGHARVLVVAQTALAIALLGGAALFLRSYGKLRHADFGYRTAALLRYQVSLQRESYRTPETLETLQRTLAADFATLPGIEGFGRMAPTVPPYDGFDSTLRLKGTEAGAADQALAIHLRYTDNAALDLLRVPLRAGRRFGPEDRRGASASALISESLARRLGGNDAVLGRTVVLRDNTEATVVGVVADALWEGRRERAPTKLDAFLSIDQFPHHSIGLVFATSAAVNPRTLVEPVRKLVLARDSTTALHWITTMEQALDEQTVNERFWTVLAGAYAATAFLLAVIGLYGALSHSVANRRQELGVRLALGATATGLARLVVGQGLRLVAIGAAVGLALAGLSGRLLASRLYGISPYDPLALGASVVLLTAVALLACWLPARRAARTDPMTALRAE